MCENIPPGIRLVVLDVDGVLTDGSIGIDDRGGESKVFSVLDGAGIKYLQRGGIKVAILSGRTSGATTFRARELGIEEVHQGIKDKLPVFHGLLQRMKISEKEVCYMGDDLTDLPILKRVGFPVTVPGGNKEVREAAQYVTQSSGGRGAVREVAEMILKKQGLWDKIMERYSK